MRARFLNVLLVTAAVLSAASAEAAPITYLFTGGQVTLTATVAGNPVAGPKVVLLNGSQVTLNEPGTFNSATFSTGTSGSIPISPSFLGFTSMNIDFMTLTASGGTLSAFGLPGPQGYNYSIGSVVVAGQFDATNVIPFSSINNAAFSQPATPVVGQLYVDTGAQIALDGITLLQIGGPSGMVVKGDFLFEGAVPEPGTALLVGLGLAGVATRRRARAC